MRADSGSDVRGLQLAGRKLSEIEDENDIYGERLARQESTISKNLMNHLTTGIPLRSNQNRLRRLSEDRINLTRILLTGGPCAGKSTAIAAISQDLTQLGYKVLVVPEAATIIMKGGAMIVSSEFTEQ